MEKSLCRYIVAEGELRSGVVVRNVIVRRRKLPGRERMDEVI